MYADYAIVISNIGPLTGIYRSLQTVRATLGLSAGLVVLAMLLFNGIGALLAAATSGSLAAIAPVLVIRVFLLGSLTLRSRRGARAHLHRGYRDRQDPSGHV